MPIPMASLPMRTEEPAAPKLPNSLFVIASVILTVLIALFLALSDTLQTRLPVPIRPTAVIGLGPLVTPAQPTVTSTILPAGTPTQTPDITPTATAFSIIAQATCNNAPANWVPIVVGLNDTLYSISIQFGATVGEIIQANCLKTGTLLPGMILYVPPAPPTREPCGPPQWWITYIVRPGETLGLLAKRHGTTVYAIMKANCLTNTKIFAGRSLFLPPIPATLPPPPTKVPPTNTPMSLPTATATEISSPTVTATPDGTTSPTATGTTSTSTAVPSNTPTITGTPPATNTPTPTVSTTTAASPTASPTTEASPTAVPTTTPTSPPTNTPMPTQPPTNTPPPTATATPEPLNKPEF